MLLLFLLLLLHSSSALHVLPSSVRATLTTKSAFSLIITGGDCPYTPCRYSVRVDGALTSLGQHTNNTTTIVPLRIATPGRHTLVVVFNDQSDGQVPSSTGHVPLVFALQVRVEPSQFCNTGRVIGGERVEIGGVSLGVEMANSEGSDVTRQYLHSGALAPLVLLTNTTAEVTAEMGVVGEGWSLTLDPDILASVDTAGEMVAQRDWALTVSFPKLFLESCYIAPAHHTISSLGPFLRTSPNLGTTVALSVMTGVPFETRSSPCSTLLVALFQRGSFLFGLLRGSGEVSWYAVSSSSNTSSTLLDLILLPDGVVLLTPTSLVTVTSGGVSERAAGVTVESGTLTGWLGCPEELANSVVATLNNDTVLTTSVNSSYTTWTDETPSPLHCPVLSSLLLEDGATLLSVEWCPNNDTVLLTAGTFHSIPPPEAVMEDPVGIHWHHLSATLFVYGGSGVLAGTTWSSALSRVLQGVSVSSMASDPYSGTVVAVSDSGRVFLSDAGMGRFTELAGLQDGTETPPLTRFFSFDRHALLHLTSFNSSHATSYGIPYRSLISDVASPDEPLYLELLGPGKIQLVAPSSLQDEIFRPEDIGRKFTLSGGRGSGVIADVTEVLSEEHPAAILEVTEPFLTVTSPHTVTLTLSDNGDGTVTLTGGVWNATELRSCVVVLRCTSFIVTHLLSSSSVAASPLNPSKVSMCEGSIGPTRWFKINLDPLHSRLDLGETVTVTGVTADNVTLSWEGAPGEDLFLSVFSVNDSRTGLVVEQGASSLIISTEDTFTSGEVFQPSEVTIRPLSTGYNNATHWPQERNWGISERSCDIKFVGDDLSPISYPVAKKVRYLDIGIATEISVRVVDFRPFAFNAPSFSISFGHRDKFQFYTIRNVTTHVSKLTLYMSHNRTEGNVSTPVSIRPRASSLRCEVPSVAYNVRQACDPQSRLFLRYPGIDDPTTAFLTGISIDPQGKNRLTELRVNYRPPSTHGKEIAVSQNVYNADPSLSLPRNSKQAAEGAEFKQCADKESSVECGCTDHMRVSDLEQFSDCRRYVYTTSYSHTFNPQLFIAHYDRPDQPLNKSYRITEVNNRTGYNVYTSEGSLSPECLNFNCTIEFQSSELFHFRVSDVSDTICLYRTEFLVYVVNAPLTTTVSNTIRAIVGVAAFLAILVYYDCTRDRELVSEDFISKEHSSHSSNASSSVSGDQGKSRTD